MAIRVGDEMYRYENHGSVVTLEVYIVYRLTPKGCRVRKVDSLTGTTLFSEGRLILHNSHKKLAWPTLEEAKHSLLIRKRRQIRILEGQLQVLNSILRNADRVQWPHTLRGCAVLDDPGEPWEGLPNDNPHA